MGVPVLIIGNSGAGKSTSIRTLPPECTALINVLGKPLPFRGKYDQIVSDDPVKVANAIHNTQREIVVIDDAGYIMTNIFMRGHTINAGGNSVYEFYNKIADRFWFIVETARATKNKRVYIIMHEEYEEESNKIRPKAIGKLLTNTVNIEGMFTICLRAMRIDKRYIFRTQSDGFDVAKTPMGMFENEEIPNDLKLVDDAICDYYGIGENNNERT